MHLARDFSMTRIWWLLLTCLAMPAAAGWKELAPMPTPRSETAAAHWRGKIYVPGGLGGLRRFEVYDIAGNTWQQLPDMPAGRHHLMIAALGGRIYVFSGADENWQATNTAWAYDIEARHWQTLKSMPEVRYAGAAVTVGSFIYALGGDGPSGRSMRYDPQRDEWKPLPASNARREHVAAAVIGRKIYLIGGRFRGVGEMRSVEVYDVEAGTWTAGPDLATARGGFTAVTLDRAIYALGGELIMGGGRKTLSSVEVLRAGADAWREGPTLPVALHGVPVVAARGGLYVLGGSQAAGAIVNDGRVFRWSP